MSLNIKYHYTYRIVHRSKKAYIGTRTSKVHPDDDLGMNYFSSSSDKDFIQEQKTHPENFKYLVISIHPTRTSALKEEISLHEFFDVGKSPMFYNRAKQTSTGFDTTGTTGWNKGKQWSDEAKKKMSEASKGQIAWNKGIPWSDEIKLKISQNVPKRYGENNSFYGKHHTDETKKRLSEVCGKQGSENGFYGKHHTKEMKENLSKKARNRPIFECKYCQRKIKGSSNIVQHERSCKNKATLSELSV